VAVKLTSGGGEGYTLNVTHAGVQITAQAPVGVQYALETLSQLVTFDFDKSAYVTQPALPLSIQDKPRFAHRGLLVDSSRHFLSVRSLKRLIRSLSYAKLNRLHWHITDAQSFPIASRIEPSLASKGAWSTRERYTLEDVQDVVSFAKDHGIIVVPEFDMPGHTKSWGNARPDLMALTQDQFNDGNSAALNPSKEETFNLIQSLLVDWLSPTDGKPAFFDSPLVHLGTDEVPYKAWTKLGDSKALFSKFVDRATAMAQGLGKDVVLWEEAFKDGKPSQNAAIQVWLDGNVARQAAEAGHRVILSQGWYLDHLDDTWEAMYKQEPAAFISADKASLMIGGEGCMWGETVDGGDLEQTVWPRLGAIAERLWSPSGGDIKDAQPRLASFRCLLLERGIPSGTLEGHGRSTPSGPGSCSQ
jgi:hexosaminidase